ncbi:MAG: YpdA family putative bacillithiol disulfide reductase [bacterium]
MKTRPDFYDVVIIGAGPAGLACAIESKKHNLTHLIIEKGCLVNSVYRFPTNMTLFSTADLLEIGGVPFIIPGDKPTRTDLLKYYRLVVQHFDLPVNLFEKVESVTGKQGDFLLQTSRHAAYGAKSVVVATGQYDHPNLLQISGEDSEKVSHYYTDGHPFYKKKVAVIGGKNSAVEAALALYKHGAQVTLIHRGSDFGASVKYWILPDIKNRVKEQKINALFNSVVTEINRDHIVVANGKTASQKIENDFVFALTGYHPDEAFLSDLGIEIDDCSTPVHDPKTLETNVSGIYIAGVITAGAESSKVFIENSRNHGTQIIGHILNGTK